MTPSHTDFIEFCRATLGSTEPNGAAITALLEAYLRLGAERPVAMARPITYDYSRPFQCYLIRNLKTGRSYAGRAAKGFLQRYPEGQWYLSSHNDALRLDALLYGVAAFSVDVFQCVDSDDMCRFEASLYDAVEHNTYNRKVPSAERPAAFLPPYDPPVSTVPQVSDDPLRVVGDLPKNLLDFASIEIP